ncbi:MAG: helix-turn-helix domain-containing protein [Candidatus Humimicrobiaceae bacterium]
MKKKNIISDFIKSERKTAGLTQKELAFKAGVGLRFIRDVEQGKTSYKADTLNKVLRLFGKTLGPIDLPRQVSDEK